MKRSILSGGPKILFERHYFHRLTQGKWDDSLPDISHKTQGAERVRGPRACSCEAGTVHPGAEVSRRRSTLREVVASTTRVADLERADDRCAAAGLLT